jgi:hypothetical protein
MTSFQHLHISDINVSLRFRQLDDETVLDYAYALSQKEELPEVNVAFDRETHSYYMVDGFHRLEAHKRNKATMITASVSDVSKADAFWLALGANAKNGRRLSIEDKRDAIATILKNYPQLSSRQIAAHVGCSHTTVLRFKESGGADVPPEPTPLLDAEGETAGGRQQTAAGEEAAGSRRQAAAEENIDDESREEWEEESEADDEIPDDEEWEEAAKEKPSRVIGTDGKSYLAKKEKAEKPTTMTSFGELAASLPYSDDEQTAAQAVVDAVFALPMSLTLRVHEGRLIL